MRYVIILILIGCAHVNQVRAPNGDIAFVCKCDGENAQRCMDKATAQCGVYHVIHEIYGDSFQMVFACGPSSRLAAAPLAPSPE